MRCRSGLFVFSSVLILVFSCFAQVQEHHSTQNLILEKFSSLPLGFEQNMGQAEKDARFVCHAPGYTISFLRGELSLAFAGKGNQQKPEVVRVSLIGSNENAEPQGIDMLPGLIHYYVGNDPAKWTPDVPQFRQVRYHNIYPGVDLIFYGNHRQLEFDFDVASGADVSAIKLKVAGATLHKHGLDLDLVTPSGNIAVLKQPELFQGEGPSRHYVSGAYALRGRQELVFSSGPYDRRQRLVIDPALIYSAYASPGESFAIAVDGSGAAYITGTSTDAAAGVTNAFIAKLDPTGSSLIYQAFLGGKKPGTGIGDGSAAAAGQAIAIDTSGNAYITGTTLLTDFPTKNAYAPSSICTPTSTGISCLEPFAAKFDATGNLVYSTFLTKASALDNAGPLPSAIAIDASGALYVTGTTATISGGLQKLAVAGLTTTAGSFQPQRKNDLTAFVLKLHPDGSSLDYATYLGGSKQELFGGIAVDSNGVAYVDGASLSADFPTTPGAFQTTSSGTTAFFSKLSADGSSLLYSTFIGAPGTPSVALGIALDANKSAYLTGVTTGSGFPTTAGAYKPTSGPPQSSDAFFAHLNFVSKFDSTGNLVYSTYVGDGVASFLGVNSDDRGFAMGDPPVNSIAVDSSGAAYISGYAVPSLFPTVNSILTTPDPLHIDSLFVTKLNSAGSALVYSTFFRPEGIGSRIAAMAVDGNQNVYLTATGRGKNTDLSTGADLIPEAPLTQGSVANQGPFVAKIAPSLGAPVPVPSQRNVVFSTILKKGTTSAPIVLQINNYGDVDLTVSSITISGTNASDFAVPNTNNSCGAVVVGGSKCSFLLTFTPSVDVGTRTATLHLKFAGGLSDQAVALTGQAGFPVFQASPSPFDFGSAPIGSNSAIQMLTVSNTGTAPLNLLVTPPAILGTNSSDFSFCFVQVGHCTGQTIWPPSIPPGTSIQIPMVFGPTGTGGRTAQMVFQTDAADSPEKVQLTGNGLPQGNGGFSMGAASGGSTSSTITAGQTATYSLAVAGSAGINVAMSCSGSPAAASCSANPNSFTLSTTGQNVTVSVSTTSRSSAALQKGWPGTGGAIAAFIGLVIVSAQRRYRRPYLIATGMLVLAALVSCGGGGGSSGGGGGGGGGTPAGTYTIVVTGSANGTSNNLSLTLTVN